MGIHHPVVVSIMKNAVISSIQIRVILCWPGIPGGGFFHCNFNCPFACLDTTVGIEVAEMFVAALLGSSVNAVDSSKVYSADAICFSGAIGVPGAIASWRTPSKRIEIKMGCTSIIALLVGRNTKSRRAIALAGPHIPNSPSTFSLWHWAHFWRSFTG